MISRQQVAAGAARLIRLLATVVVVLIALGMAFEILGGNPRNDIVSTVSDVARALAGPFDGMFQPRSHKLATAINWGVAIVVYVTLARVIARLALRVGGAGDDE
jgi:hypothetical protein